MAKKTSVKKNKKPAKKTAPSIFNIPEPVIDPKILRETSGASISLIDSDMKIIWANKYLESIHGPLPELVGKFCHQVYHNKNKICSDCTPKKAFKSKSIETDVISRKSTKGATRFLQSVSVPFIDTKGKAKYVLEILFDVTKKSLLEEDLRKSEEFYRILFEHSGTAIAVNDRDGIITSVNKMFCEWTGFKKEDIEGKKNYLEFVSDKNRVSGIHAKRWADSEDTPTKYEFVFLTKDKDEKLIDISVNRIPGTNFSISSMIDNTEKKNLEREIHEKEQFLANILKEAADGIISTNLDGSIKTWNKGAEEIFGYKQESIVGKHINILIPQDLIDKGEQKEIQKKCIETGQVKNLLTDRLRKDKRRVYIAQTLTLIKDENQMPVGFAYVIRDITERRLLEQERIQNEKMSSIGTLSASLAHEIKNPLNSIVINMEILKGHINKCFAEKEDLSFNKYINVIQSEVSRLDKVIRDFLDFAKPQSTKYKPLSINEIIENVLEFIEPETTKSHIKIVNQLSSKIFDMHGEENQLKQIFLNLLLNAVQSMPNGGKINVKSTNMPDGNIAVSISDSGSGIKEEDKKNIFEPFFTTKKKGSGLGLAMVKQLVKNHGGDIDFISSEKHGTTFNLLFPAI